VSNPLKAFMQRWLKPVLFVGASAVAALIIACAFVLNGRGESFWSSVLVNIATMFVELAVVAVFIQQVVAGLERRKWAFAASSIARTLCTAYLDVVRVLYARELPAGHPDKQGLWEFISVAEHHLSTLRSYIEGFSPILGEGAQRGAREAEAVLQYHFRALKDAEIATRDGFLVDLPRVFGGLQTACDKIHAFTLEHARAEARVAVSGVDAAVGELIDACDGLAELKDSLLGFTQYRWRWQDVVLDAFNAAPANGQARVDGIRYDMIDDLAVWYLALDHLAFTKSARQGALA